MKRRPRTFPRRQRDVHPALQDSLYREAAITRSRFDKACKLANVLSDPDLGNLTSQDVSHVNDDTWAVACQIAQVNEASIVTRVIVELVMRDRENEARRQVEDEA